MTRLQKILENLQSTDGGAGENYLRRELLGAFTTGWKAQREHGPNTLQAEQTMFRRWLEEEEDR